MLKFIFGFLVGVAFTGLMINRGINLTQRIGDAIDGDKLETLGEDIWDSAQ